MGQPLNSIPTNVVPDLMQTIFDYASGTNVVYAGYAARGIATTADAWTIFYYTYDGNNNMLTKQTAFGPWSQRTLLSYA